MNKENTSPIGRVVLTHGRSLHALVAAQRLGQKGIEVIAGDSIPFMALSFSKYVTHTFLYPEPAEDPQGFLDALLDQIQQHKPQDDIPYVLMPIHRYTRWIAENRPMFEKEIRLAAPDIESIRQIFPKQHLAKTAERYDIPIPQTQLVESEEELARLARETRYPVFFKVPDGAGGKGLIKADDADELWKGYKTIRSEFGAPSQQSPMLLQEAVEGDDYCCSGLFQEGEFLAGMVHLNIQRFPHEGGFGVVRETVSGAPLIEASKTLMKKLKWNGVVQLDYRWDGKEHSTPYLIEVNPRFWGSLFHCVESGIDYPWMLYQMTVDRNIDETPQPAVGVRTKIPVLSILSAVEESLQDPSGFDRLKEAWKTSWQQIQTGNVSEGWTRFMESAQTAIQDDNPYKRFRELMLEGQSAKQEFLSGDDPYVSLGVLYVLGSLIRHGRLPDEFKR